AGPEKNPARTKQSHGNAATNNATQMPDQHPPEVCSGVSVAAVGFIILGLVGLLLYGRYVMKPRTAGLRPGQNDEMRDVRITNLFFLPVFYIAISSLLL